MSAKQVQRIRKEHGLLLWISEFGINKLWINESGVYLKFLNSLCIHTSKKRELEHTGRLKQRQIIVTRNTHRHGPAKLEAKMTMYCTP
jgi:hypothetical protein